MVPRIETRSREGVFRGIVAFHVQPVQRREAFVISILKRVDNPCLVSEGGLKEEAAKLPLACMDSEFWFHLVSLQPFPDDVLVFFLDLLGGLLHDGLLRDRTILEVLGDV